MGRPHGWFSENNRPNKNNVVTDTRTSIVPLKEHEACIGDLINEVGSPKG